MSHCFRGLYLGGNPTPMGQQGVGDTASANTWLDVSYKHTYCDMASVTPSQNKMYNPHTGSNAFGEYSPTFYNFFPTSTGNIIPQTNPNPDTLVCYFYGTPPAANLLRMKYFDDIAKDSVKTVGYSSLIKYNMKENLKLQLLSDSALLDEPVLEDFSDSVDLVNMGKIMEAKTMYDPHFSVADSLAFKQKVSEIASGSLLPEQLNKEVLTLLSQNVSLKDSVYTTQTIDRLRQIARMCPYTKGSAVHLARKILSGINPEDSHYLNGCELQTDQTGSRMSMMEPEDEHELGKTYREAQTNTQAVFFIIPNPNQGICKIDYPINQIAKLELYGVEGKFIQEIPFSTLGEINFNAQPKGVYILKLTNKKGEVISSKIIKN